MFEYETKLAFLSQEIERQTKSYQVKQEEIKSLQSQMIELDSLQVTIQNLESEKERLIGLAKQKENETQMWQGKNEQLNQKLAELDDQKYKSENKIAMLSSEVERLNYKYKTL